MKRKALMTFTYTLASMAILSSGSALAVPNCEPPFCTTPTETVPEPGTFFGTMVIGGTMIAKKISDRKRASK